MTRRAPISQQTIDRAVDTAIRAKARRVVVREHEAVIWLDSGPQVISEPAGAPEPAPAPPAREIVL